MRSPSRFRNPGRLQDGVARSGGDFLRAVVIDADEPRPAGLAVMADRALLLDDGEAVRLQQPDEFAKLHAALRVGMTSLYDVQREPARPWLRRERLPVIPWRPN